MPMRRSKIKKKKMNVKRWLGWRATETWHTSGQRRAAQCSNCQGQTWLWWSVCPTETYRQRFVAVLFLTAKWTTLCDQTFTTLDKDLRKTIEKEEIFMIACGEVEKHGWWAMVRHSYSPHGSQEARVYQKRTLIYPTSIPRTRFFWWV